MEAHRGTAAVVYKHGGKVYVSTHNSCPFGATSSVHAWERVGRAIAAIARSTLHLGVLVYVDDFFAVERWVAGAFWIWLSGYAPRKPYPKSPQKALTLPASGRMHMCTVCCEAKLHGTCPRLHGATHSHHLG